jgi:ketosteroid isomerase-like protein
VAPGPSLPGAGRGACGLASALVSTSEMTFEARAALADRLFHAIERGDVDAVQGCYAEDAVIWHNFDDVEQSVPENLATLRWMVSRLGQRRYETVRREPLHGGLLSLHVLHGVTPAGDALALHAAMVLTMADDKVTRIDEYLDPSAAAALRR